MVEMWEGIVHVQQHLESNQMDWQTYYGNVLIRVFPKKYLSEHRTLEHHDQLDV